MKLKALYAACIALILLSCNNLSNHSPETTAVSDIELPDAKSTERQQQPGSTQKDFPSQTNNIAALDTTSESASTSNNDVLQSGNPDWDKKIIKTANITLELKDYNIYNDALHKKLRSFGAYVAQEQQSETDEKISNDISIKVPVDKFDDLVNSLSDDGAKLLDKNISTADVTGEVVDTKSRIQARQEARLRYLELLKQAKNMNEILQVQNEINTIQEQIEAASGRVNYLVHASAYSTINLKYYQYLNGVTSKDVEPNFMSQLNKAFETGTSVIINLVLFFISIWPLVIAAIILIIYLKRLRAKNMMLDRVQGPRMTHTPKA